MIFIKGLIGVVVLLGILILFRGIGYVTIKWVFREDPDDHDLVMWLLAGVIGTLMILLTTLCVSLCFLLGSGIVEWMNSLS